MFSENILQDLWVIFCQLETQFKGKPNRNMSFFHYSEFNLQPVEAGMRCVIDWRVLEVLEMVFLLGEIKVVVN